MRIAGFIFFLIVCFSCNWADTDNSKSADRQVARVNEIYLMKSDLEALDLGDMAYEDSVKVVQEFIEGWVKHNLLYAYAEKNLPVDEFDIEKQIQDYRESLVIYTYEKEYLNQNLDTLIQGEAIRNYYSENFENFTLDRNLFRIRFLIIPNDAPTQDSIAFWFKIGDRNALERLNYYAGRYAINSNFDDSLWLDQTRLSFVLPFDLISDPYFNSGYLIRKEIGLENYYCQVTEKTDSGQSAPLSYVRDDIRKNIMNQRKLALVKRFNDNIYKDAVRRDLFEIFN